MKKTIASALATAKLASQLEQANATNRALLRHLTRPRLSHRLLGTLALLGLLAAIVLVTGHRAQSAGSAVAVQVTGTPTVSVTNTPTVQVGNTSGSPVPVDLGNATLAVSNVNEPAKQPFQTKGTVNLPNGTFTATTTIAVPSGKRLVVETVSMLRSPDANSKTENVQVEIDASFNGLLSFYDLPFVSSVGTAFPGITQPMRFYADGGTNLSVVCYRTGNSGVETDLVSISGYLVNVP